MQIHDHETARKVDDRIETLKLMEQKLDRWLNFENIVYRLFNY